MKSRRYHVIFGRGHAAPRRPPLPTVALGCWQSEFHCTPAAAVDIVGGRSLPGVNTPVVAADGAYFGGRLVLQPATSGSRSWVGSGLSGLPAATTRPWLYVVGRARATDAVSRFFLGTNGQNGLRVRTANFRCLWDSAGSLDSAGASNANPRRLSTWVTASATQLQIDDTLTAGGGGYTAALVATITSVAIGSDVSGTNVGDVSLALAMICSAPPSAAEERNLTGFAREYYKVL